MRIEWLDDETALAELTPAWDALTGADAAPFLRPGWFTAWWRSFHGGARLAVATAWEGDELAAVLPLGRTGASLRALANDHTPIFAPVGTPAAVDALLDAAVRACSTLVVPGVTAGAPSTDALVGAARRGGRVVLAQDYQRHCLVRTTGSFESYLETLDRKFRKDLQRRARRLAEEVGPEQIVLAPPSDEQLTLGFEAEASGWKGQRGSSVLAEPGAEAFYRALAAWLEPEAGLRISALSVDGRFAAFDLSVLGGGHHVWILKGGFVEDYRRFAPGLVLTLAQIEAAHAAGYEAVELLGQAVPWKLRFANDEREQLYVGLYGRSPRALARYAARRARPVARGAYRSLPWVEVR